MFTTYLVLHVLKLASHYGSTSSRSMRLTKGSQVSYVRRFIFVKEGTRALVSLRMQHKPRVD